MANSKSLFIIKTVNIYMYKVIKQCKHKHTFIVLCKDKLNTYF